MRTETIEIFKFDELSDDAKEAAREWWRGGALDYDWFDTIYDDAQRVAEILGIDFDVKHVPLMNGKTRPEPKIWFSGFYSQGDGACFEGTYRYAKGAAKRIREYAPQDKTLHDIADGLQVAQKRHFYQLVASCSHRGHYYHSGCMAVDVEHGGDRWRNIGDAESDVTDALRAFADWIYDSLEKEAEWLQADEQVYDAIRANEYKFHADGTIA